MGRQKLTTLEYIEKAKSVHKDDSYDYSKVVYNGSFSEVVIICPKHGEFTQIARRHIMGAKCPRCSSGSRKQNKKTKTREQFIKEANEVHKGKYDYSLVEYKKLFSPVNIICPTHGEFSQTPVIHLRGHGCPKCVGRSLTKEEKIKLIEEKMGECRYEIVDFDDYITSCFGKLHLKCKSCGTTITRTGHNNLKDLNDWIKCDGCVVKHYNKLLSECFDFNNKANLEDNDFKRFMNKVNRLKKSGHIESTNNKMRNNNAEEDL